MTRAAARPLSAALLPTALLPTALPILLALAGPASAAGGPEGRPEGRAAIPTLTVTGHASADAKPDFAAVSVGVTTRAATTAAAQDGVSAAVAKIVAAAAAHGIAPADIQTAYVTLTPVFRTGRDEPAGADARPDGFQAANAVVARVRDLARLGAFLRAVVEGGANRIEGVRFGLSDPGAIGREALSGAVADAKAQAEAVAKAAGLRVGRVVEMRTDAAAEPAGSGTFRARAALAVATPVPVEAGSLAVSATVTVVYTLEGS